LLKIDHRSRFQAASYAQDLRPILPRRLTRDRKVGQKRARYHVRIDLSSVKSDRTLKIELSSVLRVLLKRSLGDKLAGGWISNEDSACGIAGHRRDLFNQFSERCTRIERRKPTEKFSDLGL
jgi:hypothetical protein